MPELRFTDSNGNSFPEWEVRTVSDVAELINGRAYSQPELLSSGKTPVLRVGNFFTNNSWYYSDLELDDSKYAHSGDLLYAWSATFGPKIWKGPTVIYHYHIWKVIVKSIDKEFMYHWFDFDKQKIKSMQTGGTMNHITKGVMEKRKVPLPSQLEQQKIADFFSTLDSRIEIQEDKVKNLEDQKKGYIQRIFSQELRFKDENGEDYPAWEEKRLGEFIRLQGGYAFKSSEYTDSGVPIIRISNIYKKINHEDDIVYSEEIEIDEKFIIKSGDLLIAMSGATTGKIGIYMYNTNSYLNQRVGKFVKKSNDLFYSYLYHLMESDLYIKQLKQRLIAGAQPNISPSDLESMEFIFPSFTEQQKIANFLSLFDEKIEIERKILDTLQEMKRGFLQKMFV